jgi:AAA ATPase domain
MSEIGSAGTLGDLLASRRRRRFVGRASEIELFQVALDSAEPPFSVLHLHGPAGIGKTRLLDVFAGLAADAGARVVRVDGRDLVPSAPAVLEALVCAAVESLREHPRDDKLWRAVERTYVRPAATQERAAAALGLPFSTYRRHLTQGVERVVAWLWDQEVYGTTEHH